MTKENIEKESYPVMAMAEEDVLAAPETSATGAKLSKIPDENTAKNATGKEPQEASSSTAARNLIWLAASVVLILIIVLVIVLTTRSDDDPDATDPPVSMDFTTGVSLITYYNINATISHRLARTVISMEVANALDCTSIHGVTLQLPPAARVASLKTITDNGCETRGEVQPLEEARETFTDSAVEGLPAAYVEARDDVTYSLQVSLPPMGTTVVELVLEEILRQRVGYVKFQLPLMPNEQVDQVSFEVTILDVNTLDLEPVAESTNGTDSPGTSGDGASFHLDLGSDFAVGLTRSPYSLEIPDARDYDLPSIMSGYFSPGVLPDEGVLHWDGNCFEYSFLPGSLEPKSKNIFFLVDVTHPGQHDFFGQAKIALKSAIDALTPQDTLTIQTFGASGTEDLWGSTKATENEKLEAKQFVDQMQTTWSSTNLHEALLEGMLRAKRDAGKEKGVVTLMVVLSNSWASAGATNRSRIASDVWNLNEEGSVKVFSLGSSRADNDLLKSIALMNGGVTTSITGGGTGIAEQMQSFFASEFGNILLSDVDVSFGGKPLIQGETPTTFPVLAEGTEVVVRGLLSSNETNIFDPNQEGAIIQAVTTAIAQDGPRSWTANAIADPFVASLGLPNSRCFQSYAHSRINQLLNLREVALLLGDAVVEPVVILTKDCDETTSLADCIKEEAVSLALDAQLVATGLTGLVTIDDDECLVAEEGSEICLDGTNKGEYWNEETATATTDSNASDMRPVEEDGGSYPPPSGTANAETDLSGYEVTVSGSSSKMALFPALVTAGIACLFLALDVW